MGAVAFIGDELTACGYRLAGADVYVVEPADAAEAFRQAASESALVLMTPAHAAALPPGELGPALARLVPLTLVVDDLRQLQAPPDLEAELRRALGLESA